MYNYRDPWCSEPGRNLPTSSLPSSSVIICFHNEVIQSIIPCIRTRKFWVKNPDLFFFVFVFDINTSWIWAIKDGTEHGTFIRC